MFDARIFALDLLHEKTDRDRQTFVGASQFSSPCTYCVAAALQYSYAQMQGHPHVQSEPNRYWLGAVIGTAVHGLFEERGALAVPTAVIEKKIYLGTLEGYGEIWSKPDFMHVDERALIDWKGLALDTYLPTPTGSTTMADVMPGDMLLGRDGKPVRVLNKSVVHNNDCYRLVFDDGTAVIADDEHLWEVSVGEVKRAKTVLMTSREIHERGVFSTFGQRDMRVLNTAALDLPEADLPIDPYVLGVWLGDGASANGCVTKPLRSLWEEISKRGYEVSDDHCRNIDRSETRTIYGLQTQLRELNLLNNKHIPVIYLRASYSQRLDLLRGLIDTDGYYNPTRKRVDMQTTQKWQAQAIYDLAVSFGWTCTINDIITTWQNGSKAAWSVSFSPHNEVVFLTRKPTNYVIAQGRSHRRIIKAITPVESVPTQCLEVDSTDHMYLCTRALLPTHNTTTRAKLRFLKEASNGTQPEAVELSALIAARYTFQKYLGQLMSYARGLVLLGHDIDTVSMVFVCRDGLTDDDVWAYTTAYDPDYAEKVFDRLVRLWEYVHSGQDINDLPSHSGCYECSTEGRV